MKGIITDPCYLFPKDHDVWLKALDETDYFSDFAGHYEVREGVTILRALSTRYGDGSMNDGPYKIGVDSGLLCVAEVSDEIALTEKFGIKYDSLIDALQDFARVMDKFNDDEYDEEDYD